ncbi:hypothetical protein SHO565_30550 [Streptomyces sp. HO565]
MQLQGGGGRQGGALATDDNAADVRATPRDAVMIQRQALGLRFADRPAQQLQQLFPLLG